MAVRPNTPPVPGRAGTGGGPPGAGGNLRRNPSPGPSNIRPVIPGSVRPGNPTPPPPTPFQPGAPPSPPFTPIQAGLGGLLGLGGALWGLLNGRPPEERRGLQTGDTIGPGGLVDVPILLGWQISRNNTNRSLCGPPQIPLPDINEGVIGASGASTLGVRVTLSTTTRTLTARCGSGPGSRGTARPLFVVTKADGSQEEVGTVGADGSTFTDFTTDSTEKAVPTLISFGGVPAPLEIVIKPPLLPQVAPELPEELPQAEPERQPVAPPVLPTPVAPPVPSVAPTFPRPAPTPGGAPGRAPGRAPGTAPSPSPTPGPSRPPALPQAAPITAGGVRPQLPPAPVPTSTGTTFLPGGQPLAPNGPAPTPQGIATELGKLEQKLEIMLNPNDDLSFLDRLNRIIDQTENIKFLLETLFPPEPYTFGPGGYTLTPVCDRDSEGSLIASKVAPWDGGEGELLELKQRLDALAQLIQHHKDLKQPTCGGRGNGPGSNVTVHFESP